MAIITCPECGGTGELGTCGWCGGSGQPMDITTGETVECPRCHGNGIEPGACGWCYGSGQVDDGLEDDD
ncbi:hypothetical protein GW797_07315 [Candidatus Parcubacteria bacterium]|nr:hypothetical protein [Candidatus Parcubacteria bacterium]